MIDVNLVPENLRKKRKRTVMPAISLNIPQEMLIGFIGGLLVILLGIHIIFQMIIFFKFAEHIQIKKQWDAMAADKQQVDAIVAQLRTLQGKIKTIEGITSEARILWAPKLNAISDSIPRGVWLTRISLEDRVMFIDGSAVSKVKDEMISVGSFTSNLKAQKNFMKDFLTLEVGSIQRRKFQAADLADFSITAKLRKK